MSLRIDLSAIAANHRALAALAPGAQAAAVVKADGYGLGAARIASHLAQTGVRSFFVANTAEAHDLRRALGAGPEIYILGGCLKGEDAGDAIPVINSPAQYFHDRAHRAGQPFAIQLDSGMNRLGFEPAEWSALRAEIMAQRPKLLMSHLACSDMPDDPMNGAQLAQFRGMTEGCDVPRSLSATGGILLGSAYHFDLLRPGIGLYGGQPFAESSPVVSLSVPVIQTRDVATGEAVGYACSWRAPRPSRIATLSLGYADGLSRFFSSDGQAAKLSLMAGDVKCPVVGRVSMDLITVDVTALEDVPDRLDLLNAHQTVDDLAAILGTIGYEILTSLRLNRLSRSWQV